MTPERLERQQTALNEAVTCPICTTVAMFACPQCGEQFYDHTQSLAASGQYNGLVRTGAAESPVSGASAEWVHRIRASSADAPPIDTPEHALWERGYLTGWKDAESEYGPFVPSEEPAVPVERMLRELAETAQSYLIAQAHVGVTEDELRALHYRLGCLIGPHLVAVSSAPQPERNP